MFHDGNAPSVVTIGAAIAAHRLVRLPEPVHASALRLGPEALGIRRARHADVPIVCKGEPPRGRSRLGHQRSADERPGPPLAFEAASPRASIRRVFDRR